MMELLTIDAALVESCFVRPNEWIPERFDTQPELVKDTRSFLPFAQGMLSERITIYNNN